MKLEPPEAERHARSLFEAYGDAPESIWTYMPFGPFRELKDLAMTIDGLVALSDWQPYAVVVDGRALGFMSYLRIDQPNGVIEVGSIAMSPGLQRTTAATEALYLLIKHAFDSGYRRCEWKCDDLHSVSRLAAERLGFRYEGTFRKATHYKGRSRDTAWFAMTNDEWPAIAVAFQAWLSEDNFDTEGRQQNSLKMLREPERDARS